VSISTFRSASAIVAVAIAWSCGAAVASAQSGEEYLANAKLAYGAADLEGAKAALDRAIVALEPKAAQEPAARAQLLTAYELRARTRFNLSDLEGTTVDLQTLLRYTPDYHLPGDVSPKMIELFDAVRRTTVGEIKLALTPPNAEVAIDGQSMAGKTDIIALGAGTHKLVASRPGYKTLERNFMLEAGAAQELTVALERSSATVTLITHPVGVDVYVGGAMRGETRAGEPKPEMVEVARKLNVPVTEIAAPFVVTDLAVGRHTFEFKRPCYTVETRYLDVARLDDLPFEPVFLKPAVATVRLESSSSGATVFVDDVPRGLAPRTMPDVCEGSHTVEMRSPYGRFVRRLTLRAGDQKTLSGRIGSAGRNPRRRRSACQRRERARGSRGGHALRAAGRPRAAGVDGPATLR
jgi:hypothetical protein